MKSGTREASAVVFYSCGKCGEVHRGNDWKFDRHIEYAILPQELIDWDLTSATRPVAPHRVAQ